MSCVASDLPGVMTARRHIVTVLILIVTVAFAVCLLSDLGGHAALVSNLATVGMCAAAAVSCLSRAARRRGRIRLAWLAIGLGMTAYTFGEGSWAWLENIRGEEVPFPALSDLGYLAMPPLVAAGLLLVPAARQSAANRIRSIVDGLMIATSLLLVSWIFVIQPLLAGGGDSRFGLSVVLAYPVSDVVLVTVVFHMLALLRRGGRDSGALILIGAAVVLIGFSDSVYAYLTLDDSYSSGGVLDVGWFAGFALITLAARRPAETAGAEDGGGTDEQQRFAVLLPYAAVVGALLLSVIWYADGIGSDAFSTWSRSALILLIVGRQLLTLLENRNLTRHLESRVAARTAELYASEQRFQALVQQSSDSVTLIAADSTVRYQSESVERIFGWPAAILVGQKLTEVAGHRAGRGIAAAIESVLGEPYATTIVELQLRHADGRLRQTEMIMTNLLDDPSVNGIVLNTRDTHDAKELQDQLVHEAYHDGLTGLASRALFRERLHGALEDSRRDDDVAILFLDLDGFKEVNDSLGHAAGDRLLVQVAERLRESVRDGDTVARFGGDEFAVLIESIVATADAQTVAHRIIAALDEPFAVGGRELHVGASVGIASAADAGDMQQLMRNADLAMYKAKAAGGSQLAAYDPQMHDQLVDRLELEADLRLALERDELALHYQPTVDLRTGEIVGFEALVRWHHPVRGVIAPDQFIEVAEESGLIVPMGRWVLDQALHTVAQWRRILPPERQPYVSVNVSVRQFRQSGFVDQVRASLNFAGVDADALMLEITETLLMGDDEQIWADLEMLRELGVRIAIDDFGTGYSSLGYLRQRPIDVVKIDKTFIDDMVADAQQHALVSGIISLAHTLNLTVVAEGIESDRHRETLARLGCPLGQGYFYSSPVGPTEALTWLTSPRALAA